MQKFKISKIYSFLLRLIWAKNKNKAPNKVEN